MRVVVDLNIGMNDVFVDRWGLGKSTAMKGLDKCIRWRFEGYLHDEDGMNWFKTIVLC